MSCSTCVDDKVILDTLVQGDTFILNLALKDDEGDPIDLTGSSITLTIKRKKNDVTPAYEETQADIDMIDPVNGVLLFNVPGSVTATFDIRTYQYDVVWDTASGTHATIVRGSFPVAKPVHDTHPV